MYNFFVHAFFSIVIFVLLGADVLMAQELWSLMKNKGMIREEILAIQTVTKKH